MQRNLHAMTHQAGLLFTSLGRTVVLLSEQSYTSSVAFQLTISYAIFCLSVTQSSPQQEQYVHWSALLLPTASPMQAATVLLRMSPI